MAVKFKAEGKITEDGVEFNLKIKGLSEFAKQGNLNVENILKSMFEGNLANPYQKQIELPDGQGVMLIVSNK